MKLQSVILSGGSGTRLWPLSREKYPKQLLPLLNDKTLLQSTALRLNRLEMEQLPLADSAIVVSNSEYRFLVAKQLNEVELRGRILLEPLGKNTAPALTVAALDVRKRDGDAVLLVMPADHVVTDEIAFYQALECALPKALEGGMVCFGVKPSRPETGYGYIKVAQGGDLLVQGLDSFVEKPDVVTAQMYVDSGEYLWNSGIFMMKASVWLHLIERLRRDLYEICEKAYDKARSDGDFVWLDESIFTLCPDDSIDYAVMEHIGANTDLGISAFVVPMSAGWSDVGAWDAVWEASAKDEQGNAHRGKGHSIFYNSNNCLANAASKRVVSVLGLDDVVVIDTMDAVLVAHKKSLPDIKKVIEKVKDEHIHLTQHWRQVFRPWGSYDSIDHGEQFQVKRIIVNPGQVLSLQMHHHRAEHWIVVKGTGKVTKGDEVFFLSENQSTYIPLGVVHRLENPGKFPLELIEVQSGSYLGEDDIVRFEDVYGRVPEEKEDDSI